MLERKINEFLEPNSNVFPNLEKVSAFVTIQLETNIRIKIVANHHYYYGHGYVEMEKIINKSIQTIICTPLGGERDSESSQAEKGVAGVIGCPTLGAMIGIVVVTTVEVTITTGIQTFREKLKAII